MGEMYLDPSARLANQAAVTNRNTLKAVKGLDKTDTTEPSKKVGAKENPPIKTVKMNYLSGMPGAELVSGGGTKVGIEDKFYISKKGQEAQQDILSNRSTETTAPKKSVSAADIAKDIMKNIGGFISNGVNKLFGNKALPAKDAKNVAKNAQVLANQAKEIAKEKLSIAADDLKLKAAIVGDKAQKALDKSAEGIKGKEQIINELKDQKFTDAEIKRLVIVNADGTAQINVDEAVKMLDAAAKMVLSAKDLEETSTLLGKFKILVNVANPGKEQRKTILEAAMKNEKSIIDLMTPKQLKDKAATLASISDSMKGIAGKDNGDLLVMIDAHNSDIAGMVSDKIGPTGTDYSYANVFIDDVLKQPVFVIKNDLTQTILDMIAERNKNNKIADDVAYEKSAREKAELEVSDKKIALRKKLDNAAELVQAARAYDAAIAAKDPVGIRNALVKLNNLKTKDELLKANPNVKVA